MATLHEIITTENNFVQDLAFLVRSFLAPLRASLGETACRAIFSNAEQLLALHEGLDAELQSALHGCAAAEGVAAEAALLRRVSVAFVQRLPFFKLYAVYSSNYVYAAQKLSAVRKTDEGVSAQLGEIEAMYSTQLLALLIRPVQRICQYPLLFKEVGRVLSTAPEMSEGAEQFSRVSHELQSTISTVNEKVRQQENVLRMRGILTAELHGAGLKDLLSPSRSLVHEAAVRLRAEGTLRPEWRAKRDYKLYLFSDQLLVARQNMAKSGFSLKLKMSLLDVTCELIAGADGKASFSLLHGGVTYRGSCGSKPEAELLVSRVNEAKLKAGGELERVGSVKDRAAPFSRSSR